MTENFFNRHPKAIATTQLISAVLLALCSIWYGAWYPDAQIKMHEEQKLQLKKSDVEKPDFWDVSLHNIGPKSPVAYTGLLLLFGLLSGAGSITNAMRMSQLEAELGSLKSKEVMFKDEQENHAETQRYYYDSLKDILVRFFCKQIDNFDDTCRASVYRHDADARSFRLVFRHCQITRFGDRGRVAIPDNEGVVGATLANGDSVYISDLPNKNTRNYFKTLVRVLNPYGVTISEGTVSRLRMPSRCYFGYAIRDVFSQEKFAILILESSNQNHFDPEEILSLLNGEDARIAKYVRHIAHLDSKLNPYGGT